MKIKLITFLIAAATSCIIAKAQTVVLPQSGPWDCKYIFGEPGVSGPSDNWMDLDFDDSGWNVGEGPIGNYSDDFTEWSTHWSTCWVRREFNLEDTNIRLYLQASHRGGADIYINGNIVYGRYSTNNTIGDNYCISRSYLKTGRNVIAMRVTYESTNTPYLTNGLKSDTFFGITIDVTTPGTLGDLILEQTESYGDVNGLTLSGSLNDDDFNVIKSLTNLTEVDLTNTTVTELPQSLFSERKQLCEAKLPSKLEKIGKQAFYNCESLAEIEFPETLTTIDDYAFESCKNLNRVQYPPLLTELGDGIFKRNYNLQKIEFIDGITSIGAYFFYECERLDNVVLPSTVKAVDVESFWKCYSLKNIQFNEGLTEIGSRAFEYCKSIEEITLPSTFSIAYDNHMFAYCDKLNKVTCLSLDPPHLLDHSFFCYDMSSKELYVPALTIKIYKQTDGWDQFPTIKPIDVLPDHIMILGDLYLNLPELPADYKPDVTLLRAAKDNFSDSYFGHWTVDGEGALSIKNFTQYWDAHREYLHHISDGYSTCYTALVNNIPMQADNLETYLHLYYNKWKFMTMLYDVKVSEITPIMTGTHYWKIYKYDGAKRANGETGITWVEVGDDEILNAGQGYIMQCSRYENKQWVTESRLRFPAINNANKNKLFTTEDIMVELTDYESENAQNRSWNLIGNPYPCFYDTRYMEFESPITVWNWDKSTYWAYSTIDDAYILRPGEAVFVQKPVEQSGIVFNKEGRQTTPDAREIETPAKAKSANAGSRIKINLILSDSENSDQTRIVINENAQMGYDTRDASKFMSLDQYVPQLYSLYNEVNYAINERPIENGMVELGYKVSSRGSYSITLAESDAQEVWLEDMLNNALVRLGVGESYEFDTDGGTITDRFVVHLSKSLDGINSINKDNLDTDAYYTIDGIKIEQPTRPGLYIHNGQKVYIK